MLDYAKRLAIVIVMAICIGLLFIGGRAAKAETMEKTDTMDWVLPAHGSITDHFLSRNQNHKGIDIAGPLGETIISASSGVVTKSYYSPSYGNVVFIKHPNGFETVYAHLSERLVIKNEQVEKGQEIGRLGNTGNSTGPHLHFEVHRGSWNINKTNAIDPISILGSQVAQLENATEAAASNVVNEQQKNQVKSITEAATKQNSVVVKQGETLWSLAEQHNVTVEELKRWNKLQSEAIYVGQALHFHQTNKGVYIVRNGDSLSAIAKQFQTTVQHLKAWNNLQSDVIVPQQELIIQKYEG